MVCEFRVPPPGGLAPGNRPAWEQPFPGCAAALHPRAALRLLVHRLADPPRHRRLVEARAGGKLSATRFQAEFPAPGIASGGLSVWRSAYPASDSKTGARMVRQWLEALVTAE